MFRRLGEWLGLGFLFCLPFFLVYWVLKESVGFGDEIFKWAVVRIFGMNVFGAGFIMLLLLFLVIGSLFDVPYIGPFLAWLLRPVPLIGALLQQKDHFHNIREQWKSSGCGPILVSLYNEKGLHPAAITKVFLTDYGYLAIVGVPSFPPQELYYTEDAYVYYGLPASEISAIHMTFGFSSKRTDLRGVLKRATVKELVERYHLYQPYSCRRNKTKNQQ